MAIRIRYAKNGGVLTSKAFVASGSKTIVSTIDLNAGSFVVTNVVTGEALAHNAGIKNTTVLKQLARKALLELGVALVTEVRNVGETGFATSADVSVERAI